MERKSEGRRNEEGWLLVQWISEDEGFLLKTDEKNAWQLLSLSLPLCVFLCLSLLSLSPPSPLSRSLPPTSGIYMSYWDWIDCTWEVYLTKQLKVQLVHLDELKWGWERCTASLCLSGSASPLYRQLVFLFSNTDSRQRLYKMHLFNPRNPKQSLRFFLAHDVNTGYLSNILCIETAFSAQN